VRDQEDRKNYDKRQNKTSEQYLQRGASITLGVVSHHAIHTISST